MCIGENIIRNYGFDATHTHSNVEVYSWFLSHTIIYAITNTEAA